MERVVVADGREIAYRLERKRVKNLNLRIRRDGSVFVSARRGVGVAEIDAFVVRKARFVFKAIDTFRRVEQNSRERREYVSGETFIIQGRGLRLKVSCAAKPSVSSDGVYIHLAVRDTFDRTAKARLVGRFLDGLCRQLFTEIISELYPAIRKYGVVRPVLRMREMKTRWGSCLAAKGVVTLNKLLLEVPRWCVEYVVMHELCHLVHPNHSKRFYEFLTVLMPDWQERKRLLAQTMS